MVLQKCARIKIEVFVANRFLRFAIAIYVLEAAT